MSPTPAGPSRVRDSSPHQRAGLRTAVGAEAAAIDGPASRTRSTASTAASTYRATQSALEDASRLAASKKPRKRNKWIKEEEETLKELIKTAVLESDDDVVSMATIKARDQDGKPAATLQDDDDDGVDADTSVSGRRFVPARPASDQREGSATQAEDD